MKLNNNQMKILSVTLAVWGLIFIGSGISMNGSNKPIIKTTYSVNVHEKKISQAQAKTNEIKVKDFEIEINTPISMRIEDYLENANNISMDTLKILQLDTSLVNINQAGEYQYTIICKKKKYIGTIKVKEKKLPIMSFTLKAITITTEESLPVGEANINFYIKETLPDEVKNNIIIDISEVRQKIQGEYTYHVIYNNTTTDGKITIIHPGPTFITQNNHTTPTPEPTPSVAPSPSPSTAPLEQ